MTIKQRGAEAASRRSDYAAMQSVQRSVFQAGMALQSANVGPSEWYLYTWLLTLANAKGEAVLRTNTTMIRQGAQTPYGEVKPARMALNTIKAAMESLERAKLLHVTRTKDAQVVHLDIMFL